MRVKRFKYRGKRLNKFKKNKFKIVLLCLAFLFLLSGGVTFGRYAYLSIRNFYFEAKKFYFNSDKLSDVGSDITMTNWSGVGSYEVTFNMNSLSNTLEASNDDINYTISYSCSSNVICSIEDNKTSGVISHTTNSDSFKITITVPTTTILASNDSVSLNVSATSTLPYRKTLTGSVKLVVGYYGLSYEIDDKANDAYFYTRVTNTLDYYKVISAYGGHNVGEQIDYNTFKNLSDSDKEHYASSLVTFSYDPNVVLLDMTDSVYLNNVSVHKRRLSDGYDYVDSVTFKIDALESLQVKFYKVNKTNDYSYPNVLDNSVISVSYS